MLKYAKQLTYKAQLDYLLYNEPKFKAKQKRELKEISQLFESQGEIFLDTGTSITYYAPTLEALMDIGRKIASIVFISKAYPISTQTHYTGEAIRGQMLVKPWYKENYPEDTLGNLLNDELTFREVWQASLDDKLTKVIGVDDITLVMRIGKALSASIGLPIENFITIK